MPNQELALVAHHWFFTANGADTRHKVIIQNLKVKIGADESRLIIPDNQRKCNKVLCYIKAMVNFIFYFLVLVFSVVIHEVAHGYAAKAQGDDTAEVMGRLTLNPLAHIDLFGSIILPGLLIFLSLITGSGLFLFGWAKPVPYNPLKLKNMRWGSVLIALAGAGANFLLAFLFGLLIRFHIPWLGPGPNIMFSTIVLTNLMLGVFNLMPIPPLDGSRVLAGLMGDRWQGLESFLIGNSLLILAVFLMFGSYLIMPIVSVLFGLLTGAGV